MAANRPLEAILGEGRRLFPGKEAEANRACQKRETRRSASSVFLTTLSSDDSIRMRTRTRCTVRDSLDRLAAREGL